MDHRTIVHFDNTLIGRDSLLIPLIDASLEIKKAYYEPKSLVLKVEIENNSSCDFILQNNSPYTLIESSDIFEIKGKSNIVVQLRTKEKLNHLEWIFTALNAVNSPNNHPTIKKQIKL